MRGRNSFETLSALASKFSISADERDQSKRRAACACFNSTLMQPAHVVSSSSRYFSMSISLIKLPSCPDRQRYTAHAESAYRSLDEQRMSMLDHVSRALFETFRTVRQSSFWESDQLCLCLSDPESYAVCMFSVGEQLANHLITGRNLVCRKPSRLTESHNVSSSTGTCCKQSCSVVLDCSTKQLVS